MVPGVRETVLVALREGDELGYEGGVYRVVAGGLSPAEFPTTAGIKRGFDTQAFVDRWFVKSTASDPKG
ncbi:MAG: hypothetical protein ACOYM2_19335 [Rectinemataceae bacterium]